MTTIDYALTQVSQNLKSLSPPAATIGHMVGLVSKLFDG